VTRLVLLPGLGTTGRLFEPQRREFPHLEVPPWLAPRPPETLAAYGERMAAALGAGGDDLLLGGVSFGGMVALEMARHARARAVVLIASCTTGAALTPVAHMLARLARGLPPRALVPPRPLWRLVAWSLGARTGEERALVYELIRTSLPGFAHWGLGAIVGWRPGPPPCPVRQIHGADDRLIRASRVRPDVLVAGAGHLINVTHENQVNTFLRELRPGLTLRELALDDRERVRAFYQASGRASVPDPSDRVLVAEDEGEIVGAVRLCREEGVVVLRTMRVRPDVQRRGVGRALLRRFATMLDGRECFCLPFDHLVGFYGEVGFETVPAEALPAHLAARLAGYRAERPNVIGMRRRP
jgi:pimeloyl-ACP methyl ester carboxylesterase/N-acetylglutamate synthase-like GNAT family acetyltransferase